MQQPKSVMSRREESNLQPLLYESIALPLSYSGIRQKNCKRFSLLSKLSLLRHKKNYMVYLFVVRVIIFIIRLK